MRSALAGGGIYTRLVSSLFFPLHEHIKGHDTVRRLRELERSQWWERDRILALQSENLARFLKHAAVHSPFHAERFAACGFDPDSVTSASDLARLPLLSKADIRGNFDRLGSAAAGKVRKMSTGGSSGEPLTFLVGSGRVSHDVAAKWRATRWWDVDIGDPEIVVWGSPIELNSQDRVRLIRDAVFRTELLPAFDMSDKRLDDALARIRRRRPRMLFGYPSSLSLIARHAENRGVAMTDLGIRVAFVTSERLYDDQRAAIARVFGCPVANGYGGRDAGFLAHECPSGSLHLTAEDIVVEIVDPAGTPLPPGQAGEIVVTHLATWDFPFVRYRTGDVGILSGAACACGRGLPVLASVEGRSTDFVVTAEGSVMHGLGLIYVLRELPQVAAFRIVQENRLLTRVHVVPASGFDETTRQSIVLGIRKRLGDAVQVEVDVVGAIAPEKSGKFRYVVSHVRR
ncbi:MAG: AMP-binding protein [Betaproteobacteria bacterium]|jgi:phenylacetate-CoA ligase